MENNMKKISISGKIILASFAPKLSLFVRKNLESGDQKRILKYSIDGKYLHLTSVCKVGAVSDPIGDPEGIND